jgi:predicted nucleotidyltransferase
VENELREQITALCQIEKSCKNEVQQYKIRYDQLDAKYKNLTKQQEQNKIIMANMEKRKEQLEKELANETCSGIKIE